MIDVAEYFSERFEYKIDSKSRLYLPSQYVSIVGSSVRLCKWTEKPCLFIMTNNMWQRYMDAFVKSYNVMNDKEQLFAYVCSNTKECKLDDDGRIIIPPAFMEYAGLEKGSSAVLVGAAIKAEIWLKERLEESERLSGPDKAEMHQKIADAAPNLW